VDAAKKARTLLATAEKSLRELMQRELESQRYSELAELAVMADGLARLTRSCGPSAEGVAVAAPPAQRTTKAPKSARAGKTGAPAKRRQYPVFHRDGEKLIKTGWSKKSRQEYEHRASKHAVLAFAAHLKRTVKGGSTFVMDNVLPAHDAAGDELPSYQVYLALAWMRAYGAVNKKGRDGYVLAHDALDGSAFDVLWNRTPQKK